MPSGLKRSGCWGLVAGQDVEPGDQPGTWRIASKVAADRVITMVDPDARHMHKSVGCTFRGIDRGSDCAFGYTTVGLGFPMQVMGGANLGWQVVAIQVAQL